MAIATKKKFDRVTCIMDMETKLMAICKVKHLLKKAFQGKSMNYYIASITCHDKNKSNWLPRKKFQERLEQVFVL